MTSQKLRVAAVQLNSQEDVDQNLRAIRDVVAGAAAAGARLVVLPENFAYFGADVGRRSVAERSGDLRAPIQATLSELAREQRVAIIAGGFPELGPDAQRPYNTCLVFAATGELVTHYRKVHLFDVQLPDGTELCESRDTEPGSEPVVADVAEFRVGLSICYDLRFPELYRALVSRGAEVLVVPAAFTLLTGKDHWHALLRARAIESQSYVIAAAQWGKHPRGRTTYGHALVVDPWGTIIAECSDRVGFVTAEIDRAYLEEVRTRLPSLKHRRL
ncbi:MAG TPA: carbon-nitrogen hydrolase family protein [Polyangiaceae bacterium]|nr:carbon-nitrogen hydrolase family protein [Polyangiaceae bacterium]